MLITLAASHYNHCRKIFLANCRVSAHNRHAAKFRCKNTGEPTTMEVTANRNELLSAIDVARLAVEKKTTIPILTCLHFQVGSQVMTITGTDLEYAIMRPCLVTGNDEPFTMVVPQKILTDFLKCCREDMVHLLYRPGHTPQPTPCETCDGTGQVTPDPGLPSRPCAYCKGKGQKFYEHIPGQLIVTCGGAMQIDTYDPISYPELPKLGSEEWPIAGVLEAEAEQWLDMTGKVSYAISADENRFTLNGFLLEISDRVRMVATDGHRLAVVSRGETAEREVPVSALVPKAVIAKMSSIIGKKPTGTVNVYRSQKAGDQTVYLVFHYGVTFMVARMLSGNFPDWRRVLPAYDVNPAKIGVSNFIAGIDAVKHAADERSRAVKLTFNSHEVAILADSVERGKATCPVSCECGDTSGVTVGMNWQYLREYLSALPKGDTAYVYCNSDPGEKERLAEGTEHTMIEIPEEEREAKRIANAAKGCWMFKSQADDGYQVVIMPMRT